SGVTEAARAPVSTRATLSAVEGEVLVVADAARPAAAPAPALRAECLDQHAALVRRSGLMPRAVEVRRARAVRARASADVRVLDRVDVDREAGRMGRPVARAGRGATVEGRGVVGLDRPEVVAAVAVDRLHPPD